MQHEMLQVAIGRSNRAAQPGRYEYSNGCQPIRMDVQEAENLRLRKSDRVQDGSGLEAGVLAEFDHHLHAQGPFSLLVTARKAKVLVDLPPYRADGAVRHNSERGAHV